MNTDTNSASEESSDILSRIHSSGSTDAGVRREVNEDAYLISETGGQYFYIVADGVGGPERGAAASSLAVQSISKTFRAKDIISEETIQEALRRANRDIFERGLAEPSLAGMGTSLAVFVIARDAAWIAHVGNCRIYRLRNQKITRLTCDHTLVEELRRSGALKEPAKENRTAAHILTRCLGKAPQVEVELQKLSEPFQEGDAFFLCSDGLFDLVDEEEFKDVLSQHGIDSVSEQLIKMGNDRGGTDNISVIVVAIGNTPKGKSQVDLVKESQVPYPLTEKLVEKAPIIPPAVSPVGVDQPGNTAPADMVSKVVEEPSDKGAAVVIPLPEPKEKEEVAVPVKQEEAPKEVRGEEKGGGVVPLPGSPIVPEKQGFVQASQFPGMPTGVPASQEKSEFSVDDISEDESENWGEQSFLGNMILRVIAAIVLGVVGGSVIASALFGKGGGKTEVVSLEPDRLAIEMNESGGEAGTKDSEEVNQTSLEERKLVEKESVEKQTAATTELESESLRKTEEAEAKIQQELARQDVESQKEAARITELTREAAQPDYSRPQKGGEGTTFVRSEGNMKPPLQVTRIMDPDLRAMFKDVYEALEESARRSERRLISVAAKQEQLDTQLEHITEKIQVVAADSKKKSHAPSTPSR